MPEEASVTLSANDNISAPVMRAMASLDVFNRKLEDLSKATKAMAPAANAGAVSLDFTGRAAASSTAAHRSAHQAMNLVSGALADIAGASPAASAGLRIMDGLLFKIATGAGAVSLGMFGIVAAASAVGVAMKSAAEETKKQNEATQKIVETAQDFVKKAPYLDAEQKRIAAGRMSDLEKEILATKSLISEKENLARKSIESGQAAMAKPELSRGLGGFDPEIAAHSGAKYSEASRQAQKEADALKQKLIEQRAEYTHLKNAIAPYVSSIKSTSEPLLEFSNRMTRQAAAVEEVARVIGDLDVNYDALSASAARAGISVSHAAEIMVAQNNAVKNGVLSLAQTFGETLGNSVMKGRAAWIEGLKSMVGAVFDAATQVLIAAAIMNKGLSAALIPFSFGAILGMVAIVQTLKAVAMSALSSAAASAGAAGAGQVAALTSGAGGAPAVSTPGGAATPSGGAVTPNKQGNVNYISVNLGVEALELSAISDVQLKNLAGRIGRIISDSAYTGQISFAGA